MYMLYKCNKCKTDIIVPTEQVEIQEKQGRYIACPFGHRDIAYLDRYSDLKECMKRDSYKRENGVIKQRGWGSG